MVTAWLLLLFRIPLASEFTSIFRSAILKQRAQAEKDGAASASRADALAAENDTLKALLQARDAEIASLKVIHHCFHLCCFASSIHLFVLVVSLLLFPVVLPVLGLLMPILAILLLQLAASLVMLMLTAVLRFHYC